MLLERNSPLNAKQGHWTTLNPPWLCISQFPAAWYQGAGICMCLCSAPVLHGYTPASSMQRAVRGRSSCSSGGSLQAYDLENKRIGVVGGGRIGVLIMERLKVGCFEGCEGTQVMGAAALGGSSYIFTLSQRDQASSLKAWG